MKTTTKRCHKQPSIWQINVINWFTCSRLPPPPAPPDSSDRSAIVHLVPLMILLAYSHLLLVSLPLAAQAHQRTNLATNSIDFASLPNADDNDLLRTTKETTELELFNKLKGATSPAHPLLNAGHLNRMYYAPLEQRHKLTAAREQDLRSPNNRGPSLVLSQPVGRHLKSRQMPMGTLDLIASPHFGERRRGDDKPNRAQPPMRRQDHSDESPSKFERRLMESRPAATPTSWSQPDPRRSYSAPVSKVKFVHASSLRRNPAARRLYAGGSGAWRSSPVNPLRTRIEPMKRKEDQSSSPEGSLEFSTEASLPQTSSTSSGATNASTGDFDHEPLDGAGDSTQQQPLEDLNEILPRPVSDQWRSVKNPKSARLVTTGSQPVVTLVRYVPIILNVPAALAPLPNKKTVAAALLRNQQAAVPGEATTNQQEAVAAAANKMPMILASSSDHHQHELTLVSAGVNDVPAGTDEVAQISGLGPGLSSHEIQQALVGATPASPADLHQLAHGGQPMFARLAYIPLASQPQVAQGSHMGGHMLHAGASHMTSKALAAYASKLISMLKPSHLLSSLGSGSGSQQYQNYNHHQPPSGQGVPSNGHQQILLLAPSTESILASAGLGPGMSTASHAHRVQPATQLPLKQAASEPSVRTPDLLINQASKVHSTKSQQQSQWDRQQKQQQPPAPLKDQQLRWPLMPNQMNGLICVQGLIGPKQQRNKLQQQQQQQSQEQVDLNSFDDDYEPKRPAATQQVVAGKGQQQRLPVGKGSGDKQAKGSSSKPGKGPRAPGGKESPIRMMQQKMASKQQEEQFQQQQDVSDLAQISQQKLVGLPSEVKRDIFSDERAGLAAARATGRPTQSQTQPPPAPATNFQPGDEIRSDARGRPIIPFTIRDKIDAPTLRAREQQTGSGSSSVTNNSPVQYDEPADEPPGEQSPSESIGGAGEQRRSRTTFVGTGATGARRRGGGGGQGGVDISYRKEPLVGQRDFSLPVLMASSAPRRQASPHSPLLPPPPSASTRRNMFATPPEFMSPGREQSAHYPVARSPAPPPGLSQGTHDEPIGASSSSSSVSTTTTRSVAATTGGSGETTTVENALGTSTVPPPLARWPPVGSRTSDFETMARDDSLGRLVSSVSLTGSGSSSTRRPLIETTLTSTLATPTNDTVELIVNSTPREAPITASPLEIAITGQQQPQRPGEGRRASPAAGGGGHGEPANQITSLPSSAETDADDDSLLQLMSSNSFSHDRSLTPASERTGASYGRISESLQTNPLDLIDLQNSRTSFELPAQLESLSMLHSEGESGKNNNSDNDNHDQLAMQRDKQRGTSASEHEHQRVLRGALNATGGVTHLTSRRLGEN